MNIIFRELLGVCVQIYIDDIIIFSDSIEQHFEDLLKVFNILKENKLVCQIDKCFFCLKQLKYLGKVVSGEGIATDPDLIADMVNYPCPSNVKQVRSFLGLCSCYRGFVQNFAVLAEPLTELTRSEVPWSWSEKKQKTFEILKDRMSNCPILRHPDWSKPFHLQTDASAYGAGAILSQKDENDKLHPVAYASWLFNKAQRNYTATERELLAIVLATRKWRQFFYGKTFVAETDHKPLSGQWDWKDPYGKITRWANELRQFDITIKYRKGKDNEGPDALSRAMAADEMLFGIQLEETSSSSNNWDDSNLEIILGLSLDEIHNQGLDNPATCLAEYLTEGEELLLSISQIDIPLDKDWSKAQREDIWYSPMIKWIENEELPENDKQAKWILANAHIYSIEETSGILLRVNKKDNKTSIQRCVPKKWRKLICSLTHDCDWAAAHMGRDKTRWKVRERFYFPHMKEYVAAYVAICPACQLTKNSKLKPKVPMGTIEANTVWDLVCIDLWDSKKTTREGYRYVLTVVDAFSKYAAPIPLRSKTAKEVASALFTMIGDKGPMARLHSDQGGEFCNEIINELCNRWNINKSRTTAYHPMGNAFAERIHQFYKNALTCIVRVSNREWDEFLPTLQYSYNTAIHSALSVTPYEVFYGRKGHSIDPICDEPVIIDNNAMTYKA
jgi:transposase InsO family protein